MKHLVDTGDDYVETALRQPDDEWADTKIAVGILFVEPSTFYGIFRPDNHYQQVRRMLRGQNGKLNAQGQGNLFSIDDLEKIAQIRRAVHCRVGMAARVFAAQRLGEI